MKLILQSLKIILIALLILPFTTPLGADEVKPISINVGKLEQNLIDSGKYYFATKRYDAAIRQWETALSVNPNNEEVKKALEEAKARFKDELRSPKDIGTTVSLSKEAVSVLNLDDCISIAIKNNIPLQVAEKSIKLAQMRLFEARRNMLPTAGIRYEDYWGRVQGRAYIGRKQYVEGQQAVFHGGELYFLMKQAEINMEVTKTDYNRVKNDLILQVKKAYYSLLKAKENLRIQMALNEEVAKINERVNKGYEASIIAKAELLNVTSQASQVGFQGVSAEGDVSVAELILKQAMNIDYRDRMDIKPKGAFRKLDIQFDRTLAAAVLNRPEMKINALMLSYYGYEKGISKAKGWPKVDIMGNWGLAKEEFTSEDREGPTSGAIYDPDQKLEQQWYAGVKVSMPFWGSTAEYSFTREQWVPVVASYQGTQATNNTVKFNFLDNLKYFSDRQSAEIDFTRAQQEMTKTKHDITLEVREQCFNYEKAVVQLETALNKVRFQEKDLEINRLRRELDEITDSNLIDSMIKVGQEKFGYMQAMMDCYTAVASVNKAIGVSDYYENDGEVTEKVSEK